MKQLIIFLLTCNFIFAQSDVPLTLRAQFNGSYGYTIIGNTHNEFDNWQNPAPPCQMFTQSSASLNLLPSQNIVAAYLYWSGIGDGIFDPTVNLNGVTYSSNNISVAFPENNNLISYFGSYINITPQIQNTGNGLYTFSNIDLNPIIGAYCGNGIYYLGWSIIVVYEELGLQNVQLNIYDGLNAVNFFFNNGITNLTIDNLNVIDTANAKMTYTAYNGSPNLFFDEFISLNGNILSNALNPPNNPFNGTNSFTGSMNNWNQDIDTFNIGAFINVGNTSANLTFGSAFQRFVQTVVTSIRSELSDATVQINQVTGQGVCGNRNLVVDYTVSNTNSNAVLPANVNVSLYADNTFLQTIVTPTPIAVGGSLNLQTTVNIPLSIPDNFTLKIIVDNTSSNLSQIAESNEANNEDDLAISLTPTTLTIPTFTQVNPICAGQTLNALPTTSNNGISGSWSPSINNLSTTTYTFTPNAGQCATTATMTIVVNQNSVPTFTQVNPICASQTLNILPTTSNNGISGSWSPSLNNLATTTYTFTPNAGQCATTATMTIVVNQNSVPTFTQVNPICAGQTLNALPTTSNNGISGSWSPNLNNLATTTYTFTPNTGQCATTATMTIVVNQNTVPAFTQVNPICAGQTLNALPTLSNNGISGSWSPSVNNLATTTYTFTPNTGQCATTATMTIVVNQNSIPTFTQVSPICAGQTLNILPTTSNNGISGSWSPSLNNLATTTYTFTPNAGQCATTATMTIVVNQNSVPTFTQVNPICTGQTLNALPTTSTNGISGSWSPSINNLSTTTYTFTPNVGQCATTATMTIVVNQNDIPDFADVTICSNETDFVLDNQSPNGVLGSWSPSTIDFANSSTYTFTPNNLCSSSQTITVTVVQNVFLDFEYTISNSLLDTATITITTNSSGNFLYQLDNNTPQSNPIFENIFAGSHTLTVYDQNVCENSVSKTIFIVSYPKFFTPNNDGYNDVWTIQESDYFKIKSLNIFDRFGKLIKVINSASKEWNGTYNGQNIRADDYWFTLTYIENGTERTFKSHFSLKR